MQNRVVVIGGGAAGFFAAIASSHQGHKTLLLEKGSQLLAKVRISGGGRCNVTHACFDPAQLVRFYPRGYKALRGPFTRFQPRDTISWFQERGVILKTEADGRMFPTTDSSQTVIDCLMTAAKDADVEIRCQSAVQAIKRLESGFEVKTPRDTVVCEKVIVATGSSRTAWQWLEALGHTIVEPVPSLFTFNVPTSPLKDLAGVAVDPVTVSFEGLNLTQTGPLLVTHWGFSGPAVLKLSAWGARELHQQDYKAKIRLCWLPTVSEEQLRQQLIAMRSHSPQKLVSSETPVSLPRSLWRVLAGDAASLRWAAMSNSHINDLVKRLLSDSYQLDGKTTYKEEFVTCGGIALDEVDFKTMESRKCPGLHFAGEVLDIDGVTGGFNFQAAWTTGFIAGVS